MYTRVLVPGDGGSLWDELMGLVGEPIQDTPAVEEPVGYKVGNVNDDGTYQPRDREEIERDHYKRELDEFRRIAEAGREAAVSQLQSRYTLRSMGFVFTDEGTSAWEEMGGVVKYDEQLAPERMFDPLPHNAPYAYISAFPIQ